MGMNGTTSAAPMRGCAPWCWVRSISSTAFSTAAEGGVGNGGGRADERQDAAVMVGVLFAIEEDHFGNGEDGLDDGVDLGGVAPLGEIGDALDQLSGHAPTF